MKSTFSLYLRRIPKYVAMCACLACIAMQCYGHKARSLVLYSVYLLIHFVYPYAPSAVSYIISILYIRFSFLWFINVFTSSWIVVWCFPHRQFHDTVYEVQLLRFTRWLPGNILILIIFCSFCSFFFFTNTYIRYFKSKCLFSFKLYIQFECLLILFMYVFFYFFPCHFLA